MAEPQNQISALESLCAAIPRLADALTPYPQWSNVEASAHVVETLTAKSTRVLELISHFLPNRFPDVATPVPVTRVRPTSSYRSPRIKKQLAIFE